MKSMPEILISRSAIFRYSRGEIDWFSSVRLTSDVSWPASAASIYFGLG